MVDQESGKQPPRIVLRDAATQSWLAFRGQVATYTTHAMHEVLPLLKEVEARVECEQLYAVGFIAYEAAPAFDRALPTREDTDFPLLWFGLFRDCTPCALPAATAPAADAVTWQSELSEESYHAALKTIRDAIHAGETYQVNFTYRLRTAHAIDSWSLFCELAGDMPFAAYVQTDEWTICSLSPELFFTRQGPHFESRPMKGTRPRGTTAEADLEQKRQLLDSEKDRAENIMIVDMVRNDLGRIARPGSVATARIFTPEKYPTVWQMTSTIQAQAEVSTVSALQALFPPASITGAPKRRTMQIIRELETSPRRVYTGTIGYLAPGQRAQFNVAIRTVLLNPARDSAEYGVGCGIVWDSRAEDEYAESLAKARALRAYPRDFSLLETLLWIPESGYEYEARHLQRLAQSAEYFDIALDCAQVHAELRRVVHGAFCPQRVRLLVTRQGGIHAQAVAADRAATYGNAICLARQPIQRENIFLYHKTTHRTLYEQARAACPGADDVILYNEVGEITESTIANIAVQFGCVRYTPPVACGLLAGTLRAALIQEKELIERVIHVEELAQCDGIYLLNSVRGMQRINLDFLLRI